MLRLLCFCIFCTTAPLVASEPLSPDLAVTNTWSIESGVLWQVGNSTPLPYRLVPTQISWRSAPFFNRAFQQGSRLVLRHRLSALITWIPSGPESRYLGIGGSPSFEWWNRSGTRAWFAGVGGGVGWIDSRKVVGGQGQDFTLNWFARFGVEQATRSGVQVSAGLLFQHMSNGGRTNPNPGIDAVGFTIGCSRRY